MKISEQTEKLVVDLFIGDESEQRAAGEIIQRAIDSHERDLVEAAEGVLLRVRVWDDSARALKAALERRKE